MIGKLELMRIRILPEFDAGGSLRFCYRFLDTVLLTLLHKIFFSLHNWKNQFITRNTLTFISKTIFIYIAASQNDRHQRLESKKVDAKMLAKNHELNDYFQTI
jgi:hypothetical protein